MSEGPIHHWWKSHLPERVSTNAKTALHAITGAGDFRPYCGSRGSNVTADSHAVTCSACVAAINADIAAMHPRSGDPS